MVLRHLQIITSFLIARSTAFVAISLYWALLINRAFIFNFLLFFRFYPKKEKEGYDPKYIRNTPINKPKGLIEPIELGDSWTALAFRVVEKQIVRVLDHDDSAKSRQTNYQIILVLRFIFLMEFFR